MRVLDVDSVNKAHQTPLHVHVHRVDLGCVITLAAYGAHINAKDAAGNTPLHIAVAVRRFSCIYMLLIHLQKGEMEMTRALIVLGAHVNERNNRGDTCRHIAAKLSIKLKNRLPIIRSLAICGAKRCPPDKVRVRRCSLERKVIL